MFTFLSELNNDSLTKPHVPTTPKEMSDLAIRNGSPPTPSGAPVRYQTPMSYGNSLQQPPSPPQNTPNNYYQQHAQMPPSQPPVMSHTLQQQQIPLSAPLVPPVSNSSTTQNIQNTQNTQNTSTLQQQPPQPPMLTQEQLRAYQQQQQNLLRRAQQQHQQRQRLHQMSMMGEGQAGNSANGSTLPASSKDWITNLLIGLALVLLVVFIILSYAWYKSIRDQLKLLMMSSAGNVLPGNIPGVANVGVPLMFPAVSSAPNVVNLSANGVAGNTFQPRAFSVPSNANNLWMR